MPSKWWRWSHLRPPPFSHMTLKPFWSWNWSKHPTYYSSLSWHCTIRFHRWLSIDKHLNAFPLHYRDKLQHLFFFLLNCQWVRLMAAWTLTCPVLRLSGIAGTNRCNRDVMKNRRAVLWDESKQKGSRPRTAGLRTNKPLEVYLLSSAKKQMFLRSWFKCVVLKVVNLFLNVHKLFLL